MDTAISLADSVWAKIPVEFGDRFRFVAVVTPFSSFEFIAATLLGYVVIIYGLRYYVPFSPMKLNRLQTLHNAILCVASVLMFLGVVIEVSRQLKMGKSFLLDIVCDPPAVLAVGRLAALSWYFHLSKFYELVDTLFLALGTGLSDKVFLEPTFLGKSSIRFLHTYHHVLTLLATYYSLHVDNSLGWIAVLNNTFVHIFMYYYYAIRTLGYSVWWKEYLTQLQIFQFCVNIVGLCVWAFWSLTQPKLACSGTWTVWGLTAVANVTFLYLFIQMYRQNYGDKVKSKIASVIKKD